MNYKLIYENLINRAKDRKLDIYTESHHIIPRCMNGDNCAQNLVDLTPEEHHTAHLLLVKIYPDHIGLIKAAVMMSLNLNGNRPKNKLYGWLRRKHSESTSGENNVHYGKPRSDEVKAKISASNKGKSRGKGRINGPLKEETRQKISHSLKGRPTPHMVGNNNPMHRQNVKEKALASRKGKLRVQKRDSLIFIFQNIITDEVFEGTRQQFRSYVNITSQDITGLLSGSQITAKNWRLFGNIREALVPGKDYTIYKFKNLKSEEIFAGTRTDFLKEKGVESFRLIHRRSKSAKGWILIDSSH